VVSLSETIEPPWRLAFIQIIKGRNRYLGLMTGNYNCTQFFGEGRRYSSAKSGAANTNILAESIK